MQQFSIKSQRGFNVFELMGALIVFAFIIVVINEKLNMINQVKIQDQVADQSKSYTKMITKYLTDNYRNLLIQTKTTEVVIPFAVISGYIPTNTNTLNKYYQTPCIYLTAGSIDTINAYLIFANKDTRAKNLSRIEAGNIAKAIGGNAGVLVNTGGGVYSIYGSTVDNISISSSSRNMIIQSCGLATFSDNSLIINLSQDKSLFGGIKGLIDQVATPTDTDPSLKKLGNLTTMQSNLYLDNVIKESSSYQKYYCDASKLLASDANNVCVNYANASSMLMYRAC